MVNRKILYGYQIENGEITRCKSEQRVVEQIYRLYRNAWSYQKIADCLNDSHIPFSRGTPLWNKHKVKRLLENPRYIGENGYPALIEQKLYEDVQESIRSKAEKYAHQNNNNPVNRVKAMLRCAACGGRLLGVSGQRKEKGMLHLKCEKCGTAIIVGQQDLLCEVSRKLHNHTDMTPEAYIPSAEVIRLTNRVNRELEQPEDSGQTIDLIMKAAAARYDCCTITLQDTKRNRLTEVDWKHFGQAVSYITISADNDVTLYFQ